MCYEFCVLITDDLWPLWKVNLKHERKCELLESVDELSEVLWCCVSWCWCCIGRGKSISVFVSQCPGGGSQGYERDLLVDLRLLWPPANCTDIFRIFSDNLGSVKLLSFRTDNPVSPSVEHHINSSSRLCEDRALHFVSAAHRVFLISTVLESEGWQHLARER